PRQRRRPDVHPGPRGPHDHRDPEVGSAGLEARRELPDPLCFGRRRPSGSRAPSSKYQQRCFAAPMQETIDQPLTVPDTTGALVASAERAAEWAGEPFLHAGEDPAEVLAPGTARRRALDDAIAELDAGRA